MTRPNVRALMVMLAPGILVAATGVGAGDLATAALTGHRLGVAILWAVVVGAFIKFVLNEGLARWQLATGETLLEGFLRRYGLLAQTAFLIYFLLWSWFVASALMGACGVTAHALVPVFSDATTAKIVFGIAHSMVGAVLVQLGGFKLFEKVMSVCIALMFVTVTVTAVMLWPDAFEVLKGLTLFQIPHWKDDGLSWTVALMGGVGGTLTVLCYGYWIREVGREGTTYLKTCRIDLAVGYLMTAVFGIAMVVIGSTITVEGGGATLVVALGNRLGEVIGPVARWAFLIGAWGAVFSSLLGVWQSVPYLFTDFCRIVSPSTKQIANHPINTKGFSYIAYLWGLASIPAFGLAHSFAQMQKVYAIIGAGFMPMLAIALLLLNGRAKWVGQAYKNRLATNVFLLLIVAFFLCCAWIEQMG